MNFDLVVIGGGPGGYVAAIRGAQLGLRTALVEREALGGVCLNWGCIPTKALLRAGELYAGLDHLNDFGISISGRKIDFTRIVARSRDVSAELTAGISYLMKKNKIEVIFGTAKLGRDTNRLAVSVALTDGGERRISTSHVIIATGARARTAPLAGLVPNGRNIWSYREAMTPKELPKSLAIVGSGAIGIEFASFYNALGVDVTVIETQPRILPVEDEEVSTAAQKSFKKRGIKFYVNAKVDQLNTDSSGVILKISTQKGVKEINAACAIVAIGITANVEDLGLEVLGVKLKDGHISVNTSGATNIAGVFAIGDVAGAPWLAHKASHEAVRCVEAIAKLPTSNLNSFIPGCTYSTPQIASVGLTEEQAKSAGHVVKVGRYSFKNHGKAISSGDREGFVKTIYESSTGKILGVHMIGAEVTEMIQGFVIAMTLEATEAEIIATVFPHPTMSEAMHESTLSAFGRAIHS